MDTKRSDAIISRFREMPWKPKRIVFEYEGPVFGTPNEVFPLLCPAREADWIPTWDASVIYSETGYAAPGDVFRTEDSTGFGAGVWVFIAVERNRFVELVQVTSDILIRLRVSLDSMQANEEGQETMVRWDYVLTSTTPKGAEKMAEEIISEEKFRGLTAAMDHYLRHGQMIPLRSAGRGRL